MAYMVCVGWLSGGRGDTVWSLWGSYLESVGMHSGVCGMDIWRAW